MMIHNRSQRRIKDSISDRTLSKKEFDHITSMSHVDNNIFVFISNNVTILRCFYMAQQTIADRFNVTRRKVNELVSEWSKRGYFNKTNRFNNSCIYRTTPLLKMIVMALLPLIPDLYMLNRKEFHPHIKLQAEKLYTIVNKELLSEGNNNYLSLSTYDSKRTRAVLATVRAEEIRIAALSLHCVGPSGSNVTWVRGNAPQFDNSIVEKEREMSNESYNELDNLFPDWKKQDSHGPSTRHPLHKHATNNKQPIKGREQTQYAQNKNVNVPPRHEVGEDGMIIVKGKKFLPQRIGNEWKSTPDFEDNRDISVEREKFEQLWEDPAVRDKAKKVGTVRLAENSFFREYIMPKMSK